MPIENENRDRTVEVANNKFPCLRDSAISNSHVFARLVNLPRAPFRHSVYHMRLGRVGNHWLWIQIRLMRRYFGCWTFDHDQTCVSFEIRKSRFTDLVAL